MTDPKKTSQPGPRTAAKSLTSGTPKRASFKIDTRGSAERREDSDRREQVRLAEVRRTPKDRRKKAGWNGSDV